MRYTRNRQLFRYSRNTLWLMMKCQEIKDWNSVEDNLDKSFKWHRDCYPWGHNWVEFGYGDSHTLVKSK